MNKQVGRWKQWTGERMGREVKTTTSDDFKSLEVEMSLRHKGMERLQKSMTLYVKSLSKRNDGDDKEKSLPVGFLGSTMVHHGEEFESDSLFGQCLISVGRTHQEISLKQDFYVGVITGIWLQPLERSLAQMKEYQAARKKLESRRLAYDTALAKMQKAKKEDFKTEEELRVQKAKYEESHEDVYRRMQDIKETEQESMIDLYAFAEAELKYYEECEKILHTLMDNWPADAPRPARSEDRRENRSRPSTAHTSCDKHDPHEEETPMAEVRPAIRSTRTTSDMASGCMSGDNSDFRQPSFSRATTFEGIAHRRESPPAPMPRLSRVPSENFAVQAQRTQLRPVQRMGSGSIPQTDIGNTTPFNSSSPERYFEERQRSASPATSYDSGPSRSTSYTTLDGASMNSKRAPPPPPPSRTKKPPPPPPPMKRSALSTNNVSYA